MVVKTVVHFEIPVNDIEKQKEFYSKVFGWKFEQAKIPGMEYWLISTGPRDKSIGGGMYRKMAPTESPRNYVNVDNLDAAIETFKAAGGSEIIGKMEVPGMGWSYVGTDPEGNAIALWQSMMKERTKPRKAKKGKKKTKARRRSR
jgi:predicted enzyme related to lactoylglutathione lyase